MSLESYILYKQNLGCLVAYHSLLIISAKIIASYYFSFFGSYLIYLTKIGKLGLNKKPWVIKRKIWAKILWFGRESQRGVCRGGGGRDHSGEIRIVGMESVIPFREVVWPRVNNLQKTIMELLVVVYASKRWWWEGKWTWHHRVQIGGVNFEIFAEVWEDLVGFLWRWWLVVVVLYCYVFFRRLWRHNRFWGGGGGGACVLASVCDLKHCRVFIGSLDLFSRHAVVDVSIRTSIVTSRKFSTQNVFLPVLSPTITVVTVSLQPIISRDSNLVFPRHHCFSFLGYDFLVLWIIESLIEVSTLLAFIYGNRWLGLAEHRRCHHCRELRLRAVDNQQRSVVRRYNPLNQSMLWFRGTFWAQNGF